MRRDRITYLISRCIIIASCFSCSTFTDTTFNHKEGDDIIYRAINDFIHNEPRLLSDDTFFHVFLSNNNPRTINIIGDDQNKIPVIINIKEHESVAIGWDTDKKTMIARDTIKGREIISVDMSNSEEHPSIWFDPESVDISYSAFPDKIFMYFGKIFFWFDETTQNSTSLEIVNVFYQYNYVDTLVSNMFWPYSVIDDGKDMVSYSFSGNGSKRFRKRIIKGFGK